MNTGLKLMKFYVENVITNPTGSGLTETLISHFGDTKVFILKKKKKCFDPNLYFILFPINQIM